MIIVAIERIKKKFVLDMQASDIDFGSLCLTICSAWKFVFAVIYY